MIADFELIDFIREFRKPKQQYESLDVFKLALMGKFYGRISSDDIQELIRRCKHLGLLYTRRDFIHFL